MQKFKSEESDYQWVLYNYDSVVKSVKSKVFKEYMWSLACSIFGLDVWVVIINTVKHELITSFTFAIILAVI